MLVLVPLLLSTHAPTAVSWIHSAWHRSDTQGSGVGRDRLDVKSVSLEIGLCVVEDLTSGLDFRKRSVGVAGHDGSVVDEVQEAASMLGQDDLLLCAFDGSCKVLVVSLLELLARLDNVSSGPVSRFGVLTMLLSWASATRL